MITNSYLILFIQTHYYEVFMIDLFLKTLYYKALRRIKIISRNI